MFADLLVSAGTRCTFAFLKKQIIGGNLKGSAAKDVLALLPLKMDVSEIDQPILESMWELVQNQQIQEDAFTRRAAWLSFGTLVHKACAHNNYDARVAWRAVEGKYQGSSQSQQAPRPQAGENQDQENMRCPMELRQRLAQVIFPNISPVLFFARS